MAQIVSNPDYVFNVLVLPVGRVSEPQPAGPRL